MKSRYKEILISLIPPITFMLAYRYLSFGYAVALGFGTGIITYLYKYYKEKKLSVLDYLGIFGLIIQTVVSLFAENPMTYFIYPVINNLIYVFIFGGSLIAKNDIVSIIGKNLCETDKSYNILKPLFRRFTLMWSLFFLIKTIVKVVGITSRLSFELMYTINLIIDTPISILLLWFCYWYPDRYYFKKINNIAAVKIEKMLC